MLRVRLHRAERLSDRRGVLRGNNRVKRGRADNEKQQEHQGRLFEVAPPNLLDFRHAHAEPRERGFGEIVGMLHHVHAAPPPLRLPVLPRPKRRHFHENCQRVTLRIAHNVRAHRHSGGQFKGVHTDALADFAAVAMRENRAVGGNDADIHDFRQAADFFD